MYNAHKSNHILYSLVTNIVRLNCVTLLTCYSKKNFNISNYFIITSNFLFIPSFLSTVYSYISYKCNCANWCVKNIQYIHLFFAKASVEQ